MKSYFIHVGGNLYLNVASISHFKPTEWGNKDGYGWATEITIGKETYHLKDQEAREAIEIFNKATDSRVSLHPSELEDDS